MSNMRCSIVYDFLLRVIQATVFLDLVSAPSNCWRMQIFCWQTPKTFYLCRRCCGKIS
jgi:hypothetical protein